MKLNKVSAQTVIVISTTRTGDNLDVEIQVASQPEIEDRTEKMPDIQLAKVAVDAMLACIKERNSNQDGRR